MAELLMALGLSRRYWSYRRLLRERACAAELVGLVDLGISPNRSLGYRLVLLDGYRAIKDRPLAWRLIYL